MEQLAQVKAAVRRKGADALLVTQPENRRYLSGYTAIDLSIAESSGVLVIPVRGTPLLLTDSRYQLQAEMEAAGFDVVLLQGNLLGALQKILQRLAIRRLAFESHYLLYDAAKKLFGLGRKQGIEMIPTKGMAMNDPSPLGNMAIPA